ncbi:MAG: MBOAT family protein [Clostridia bacterium]|nr:MBOAT family protein [Clostridia bacterium]
MIFTSPTFIFVFFPICVILYLISEICERFPAIKRIRLKDIILIVFSLIFYVWSGWIDAIRLIAYVVIVYCLGLVISTEKRKLLQNSNENGAQKMPKHKLALITCVVGLLAYLVFYKFVVTFDFNGFRLVNSFVLFTPLLGISFIVFSTISYLVDIYRGDADGGSIIDCALFITFFPKIISGPIVLWKDFSKNAIERKTTLDNAMSGIVRIMIGFVKKLILADTFGTCLALIGTQGIDQITALASIVLYFLQIYYDFAGYSDIAIGVSRIFGFDFKENFNFPYCSTSITEFWRRWHISLGTWFREYLYIPLGGNRKGKGRTLLNLAIVFTLTGIWHGTTLNYLLWGAINAVFVVVERLLKDTTFYKKTPSAIKWIFTTVTVMLFWQLFRFNDIGAMFKFFGVAFGFTEYATVDYSWTYYLDKQVITFAIIGLLGATVLGIGKIREFTVKIYNTKVGYGICNIFLVILFVLSIIFMVNSSFSPFIYFQY